jgi:hypothetical protein
MGLLAIGEFLQGVYEHEQFAVLHGRMAADPSLEEASRHLESDGEFVDPHEFGRLAQKFLCDC